jgi:hypothetical protein
VSYTREQESNVRNTLVILVSAVSSRWPTLLALQLSLSWQAHASSHPPLLVRGAHIGRYTYSA